MPAKRSFVRGSKAIHAVQRVRAGPGRHLHNVANSATPHLRVDEGRGLKRQARSSDAAFLLFVSADNPRRSATRPLQRLEFFLRAVRIAPTIQEAYPFLYLCYNCEGGVHPK